MSRRGPIMSVQLLDGAATSGVSSEGHNPWHHNMSFQILGSDTVSGAATVKVYGANTIIRPETDGTEDGYWTELGTLTLTLGTSVTSDSLGINAPYRWLRMVTIAITGTSPSVDGFMAG